MGTVKRREFLAQFSFSVGAGLLPFLGSRTAMGVDRGAPSGAQGICWLDVAAPFIVEDPALGIHSEIILTSDTFSGASGHEDGVDATEYEIYLYDAAGKAIGTDGVAKRLVAPAMHTTVLPVSEMIGAGQSFIGGSRIRLRPRARTPMHASDLFSSAFVRWTTENSFDNVHANPDPLQWQRPESFFYSMPFPPLRDYECVYSIFNPYAERTFGEVTLHDPLGQILKRIPYDLKRHTSIFLDLRRGELVDDVAAMFGMKDARDDATPLTTDGGTVAVTNAAGSVKNFGYLLVRQAGRTRFSIDHPIHQGAFPAAIANKPFDASGRFKAKNVLYTPLLFNSKRVGGITLDSRFHLSSGAPIEEHLWLSPFVTDKDGSVPWQFSSDTKFQAALPSKQIEGGAIKLGGKESCILDCSALGLPRGFSGGLSLPISPMSNHTLMKVEVRVKEWGAHAFTHFRPGLAASRAYQKPAQRGRLATDYITSGARLEKKKSKIVRDEIICVINIDDKSISGRPVLEVFSPKGLVTKVPLGDVPAFACRQYLLSDLLTGPIEAADLSLRLVDEQCTILMSIVHIDHARRDIALDHGSDRFSTFTEFTCDKGWA
jgi:hypothetical protein